MLSIKIIQTRVLIKYDLRKIKLMKGKALRKHRLHEKTAKLFVYVYYYNNKNISYSIQVCHLEFYELNLTQYPRGSLRMLLT